MYLFSTRQKQREMTWQTENKHFTEPPYYTHVKQNNQVLIVPADAVLTQTLSIKSSLDFSEEFLSILIHTQSSRFNSSLETRLTYINRLGNSCEFWKTWDCKQMYRLRLTVKQMDKKSKKPTLMSILVPQILSICIIHWCRGCHPKGLIVAS